MNMSTALVQPRKHDEHRTSNSILDCGNIVRRYYGLGWGWLFMITLNPQRKTIAAGTRFGKLVVLSEVQERGTPKFIVRCDCGNERIAYGHDLREGSLKACAIGNCRWSWFKHGFNRNKDPRPEYSAWVGMNGRCYNPENHKYKDYGGRGIRVCARWRRSFINFISDVGLKPSVAHSLHRIDNDGDYSTDNCCWAIQLIQQRNRRSNRVLTHHGVSLTVAEWAERLGVRADFIHCRLTRGWTPERALTQKAYDRGQNNNRA